MDEKLVSLALAISLAAIMFSLGLGLTLEDFKRVLRRPVAFLTGAASQVVIVPLVAYAMVMLFGLSAELAVGFMILAFCPGGVTSNIVTKLGRGDVALSVSLTAVISLFSVISVPVLVAWAVQHFLGSEAPPVSIAGLAIAMFLITTLPVLAGLAVRRFKTDFANRVEPVLSQAATVLFVVIVIVAVAANWSLFVENLALLGPALIALNILLIVIGGSLARVFGLDMREIKTIMVETGVQNGTMGITLGGLIAAQAGGFGPFVLASAVYGVTMYLVTVPFILWFKNK